MWIRSYDSSTQDGEEASKAVIVESWLNPSWYDSVVQLVLRCFELLEVKKPVE